MCEASYLYYFTDPQNLTSMAVIGRADSKGLNPRNDDSSDPPFSCRGTAEDSVINASAIPPFIFGGGNRALGRMVSR